jgi:DNA modification methylase
VPTIRADDLTPDQVKALRIADNKVDSLTSWDMELLPIELGDPQGVDFDISLLGFSAEDLAAIMAPAGTEGLSDPDDVPDTWSIKKVNPQSMVHLTEKPVELARRAIEFSSRPGENVLDLFGGSGSTLIGAEMSGGGRRAFLMELDALYCDVIVQRWEKFTGRKAERCAAAEAPK